MSSRELKRALSFIDSGLLKGERTVFLIHGHGTSALKSAIRDKLKTIVLTILDSELVALKREEMGSMVVTYN